MKIAMVGARALDLLVVAEHVAETLQGLPEGSTVLLRRGRISAPGDFEVFTQALCLHLGINYQWCQPDEGGREAVYLRDIEMVAQADRVVAYFAPGSEMDGGTGHVVEKAIDADRMVDAYVARPHRGVDWFGGHEPTTTRAHP